MKKLHLFIAIAFLSLGFTKTYCQCNNSFIESANGISGIILNDGFISLGPNYWCASQLPGGDIVLAMTYPFNLTATPTSTYDVSFLWSPGDGHPGIGTSDTLDIPQTDFGWLPPGTHTYTCTVTLNSRPCSYTFTASFIILPKPTVAFTYTAVCPYQMTTLTATVTDIYPGDNYNFNWSGSDNSYTKYDWNSGVDTVDLYLFEGMNPPPYYRNDYTLNISDQYGCFNQEYMSVYAAVIIPNASILANALCNGNPTGIAMAAPTGGNTPYSYLWSDANSQTTATATGLSAGTYTVIVSCDGGCSSTESVTITQSAQLSVSTTTNTNVSCSGGNNGSVTANPSGGVSPYTYLWSDGNSQTTATATGLSIGTYTVNVSCPDGCDGTAAVTITQPIQLTASASTTTNVSCYNGNNGSALASQSGGTSPYTYLWSDANSQTGITATGLSFGTYTVNVMDNNGCTATATTSISQPTQLTASTSTTNNVSCFGGNNGIATASQSGGTSPYTYLWSDGNSQTGITATGLSFGTYTVNIMDNNGCAATATASITQPTQLTALASATTNVSCFGGNDGSAMVSQSGGTSPYTYFWSDGNSQTGITATGLSFGTYTVNVMDNNGCSATATATISQPTQLSASANTAANVSCYGGNNGSSTASQSGGTSPYTYLWSDGNSQTAITATGLSFGTYTVTVSDNNGCSSTAITTITQPAQLIAYANPTTNVGCYGGNNGSASAGTSGGTSPYTYLWSDGNSQTNITASGLSFGTYTVTVSDNNGCTATASVSITQSPLLTANASIVTNVSCSGGNDGSATASISGGTSPYTYLWSDMYTQTTATANGLSAGTYSVGIADNNGCITTASVTITQPTAVLVTSYSFNQNGPCNGSASVSPSGGVAPYTYSWTTGGQTTASITTQCAGTYCCIVTDNNGCSQTTCVEILNVTGVANIAGSNSKIIIYPNPNKGQFTISGIAKGMIVEMYDVSGQKMSSISANDASMQVNMPNQPNGVYFYRVLSENGALIGEGKLIIQK